MSIFEAFVLILWAVILGTLLGWAVLILAGEFLE